MENSQNSVSQPDVTDYDKSGYDYTKYWEGRQYEHQIETRVLENLLPSHGESLLDIGGGFGRLTPVYQPRFDTVTILDYSQKLLDKASETARRNNWSNVKTVRGDVYKLPFADNSFDWIVMVRVMHHLENPGQALAEISRVLKPSGTLVLEAANKIHLKAVLREVLKGNLKFRRSLEPVQHQTATINHEPGIFYNFHPRLITNLLTEHGLTLTRKISVSNLRIPILKRVFSNNTLTTIDRFLQPLFSRFSLGPSIWYIGYNKKQLQS